MSSPPLLPQNNLANLPLKLSEVNMERYGRLPSSCSYTY